MYIHTDRARHSHNVLSSGCGDGVQLTGFKHLPTAGYEHRGVKETSICVCSSYVTRLLVIVSQEKEQSKNTSNSSGVDISVQQQRNKDGSILQMLFEAQCAIYTC